MRHRTKFNSTSVKSLTAFRNQKKKNPESGIDRKSECGIDRKSECGIDRKPKSGIDRKSESGIDRKSESDRNLKSGVRSQSIRRIFEAKFQLRREQFYRPRPRSAHVLLAAKNLAHSECFQRQHGI